MRSSGSWDLLPEQQEARSRFLASCYFYLFVVTRGLVTRSPAAGSRSRLEMKPRSRLQDTGHPPCSEGMVHGSPEKFP